MHGEYAVMTGGEWIAFRVSEKYARMLYERDPRSSLYKVEGRDLKITLLESRLAPPVAA